MLRFVALLTVLLLPAAAVAQSQATIKTYPSKYTVEETVSRLTKVLEDKGITVAAQIDHATGAANAGLSLPPTVLVVFGNPKLGTPLMQAEPRIGLDLPMRMLVWQDGAGKVWLGYTPPSTLQARYGISSASSSGGAAQDGRCFECVCQGRIGRKLNSIGGVSARSPVQFLISICFITYFCRMERAPGRGCARFDAAEGCAGQ
ncbi:MAG: DUF302 domain-containing protein [Hyphomicrobiaceae bacterium]